MKLTAACTPFEALSPAVWAAFRKMVQDAGRTWGLDIAFEENPTITEAIANYWRDIRIHQDSMLAKPEDG